MQRRSTPREGAPNREVHRLAGTVVVACTFLASAYTHKTIRDLLANGTIVVGPVPLLRATIGSSRVWHQRLRRIWDF